ncbi:MAG TPA: tol-pal system protein YbgF [Gemmatimonadaceae bacterium]|nr:tol-pal system protein YbgF [Gemmatimonadaceae bacterium]
MIGRIALRRLAPVALLATGACFATRSDVRILQEDVQKVRTDMATADAAQNQQMARLSDQLANLVDSVRVVSERMAGWQPNVLATLRNIQEQLLQVQELSGQSQRRLQELRTEMERNAMPIPPVTGGPTPADTSMRPPDSTVAAPVTPAIGPNQLYSLSYDQLRRGSYGAARAGFTELLRSYPESDLAPDAQFYIAESHAAEGSADLADAAYLEVVNRWPRSPRAATALYKHALYLQRGERTAEARQAFQKVLDTYPSSDEAVLAREALRTLP